MKSMHTSYPASAMVSSLVFPTSPPPKPLLIESLSLSSKKNLPGLWNMRSSKDVTLGPSPTKILKLLWAPFSLPPFWSYRNQEKLASIAMSRITHFQSILPHLFPTSQSIPSSTQIPSPQPGKHSPSFRSSYTASHLALNWPPVMSRKHIARFHYTIPSGLQLSSSSMNFLLPLTLQLVSGLAHQLEPTVKSGMQHWTSCVSKALGPYWAGLTATYSFKLRGPSSWSTMDSGRPGMSTSLSEVIINMVDGFSIEDTYSKTALLKSLMKTVTSQLKTYHYRQAAQQKMLFTHTTLRTLTTIHNSLEYLGSCQKTDPLLPLPHTLVLTGTSRHTRCPWGTQRKRNTSERQRNGLRTRHTPSKMV